MRRFSLKTRTRIGHFGDIYEELRLIYESLPKAAPQREKLLALAYGISDFEGGTLKPRWLLAGSKVVRRFSLYKRGQIWYAQIFNPATRKYLPGRPTGERDRRAAEHVADDWLRDGIPEARSKHRRPIAEAFEVSALVSAIRRAPLTAEDAERIVRVLKDQELVETAIVRAGPAAEGLLAFLNRFWNCDTSPYVRQKLAHGHRIGRRHCHDMTGWIRTCWEPFLARQNSSARFESRN